jgi:hypothetical protein
VNESKEAHDVPRNAPAQLHRLRDLIQRGDAEGFAKELNLDSNETREWFKHGFTAEGYGAKVTQAIGTFVLNRILTTSSRESRAHG